MSSYQRARRYRHRLPGISIVIARSQRDRYRHRYRGSLSSSLSGVLSSSLPGMLSSSRTSSPGSLSSRSLPGIAIVIIQGSLSSSYRDRYRVIALPGIAIVIAPGSLSSSYRNLVIVIAYRRSYSSSLLRAGIAIVIANGIAIGIAIVIAIGIAIVHPLPGSLLPSLPEIAIGHR
ncbi:hypothetical protein Tco_0639022 [Tanacetum coccineum]